MQYDPVRQVIYWVAVGQRIERVTIFGQNPSDPGNPMAPIPEVVVTGLTGPSFDLDLTGDKLYWARDDPNEIRRANLDGSDQELVFAGIDNPGILIADIRTVPDPTGSGAIALVVIAASARLRHLRRLLRDYVVYYNGERVHTRA